MANTSQNNIQTRSTLAIEGMQKTKASMTTRIPRQRETARSGLKALRVLNARKAARFVADDSVVIASVTAEVVVVTS